MTGHLVSVRFPTAADSIIYSSLTKQIDMVPIQFVINTLIHPIRDSFLESVLINTRATVKSNFKQFKYIRYGWK